MRHRITWLFVAVFFGASLSACNTQTPEPTFTPTVTIEPTSTLPPTQTNTPVPTETPEPTATVTATSTDTPEPTNTVTPTVEPTLELGEIEEVPKGGFSFQPVIGYTTEIDEVSVFIVDGDMAIIISLFGATTYDGNQTHEEIIDGFLGELEESGFGEIEKGETYPIIVSTIEGTAFNIKGMMFDSPFVGQTILVMPSENQYLYGFAVANLWPDINKWEVEGSKVFAELLESIEFIDGQDFSESSCLVSTDNTYGYSIDNPIKVGGDWLDGPPRERAYLDSLNGPNGETINYERAGSLNHGDTILDEYTVSYAGKSFTLYLDQYSYEELMAPVDFICWRPIPLSAP